MTHRVVAEIAGQAAAKARQAGPQGHLEALLVSADEIQRVAAVALHHCAIGHHLGHGLRAKTAGAQQRARWQADEAVAAETLAAHHRFQQETVFAAIARVR